MGRLKKKPDYDPQKIMKELLATVSEIYNETGELNQTAVEIGVSALKTRKLLITAGKYKSDLADEVGNLFRSGKSVLEIQEMTGLGKSSVNGYLPYTKIPYNTKEVSQNAERIRLYRKRKECVEKLKVDLSKEALWETVEAFQGIPFRTAGNGLLFSYVLSTGKGGSFAKDLIVSQGENSKTLSWSSVCQVFERAKEERGEIAFEAKALGDNEGISYIYALFLKWGLMKGL